MLSSISHMKNRYFLPMLMGLACLGCSKSKSEPDPLSTIFNTIVGEYRFTKVQRSSYNNTTGTGVTGSTEACDIPAIIKRASTKEYLELTMGLVNPVITGGRFDTTRTASNYYYFSASRGTIGNSMSFKIGTDSIEYHEFLRGTGGGWSNTYYGKKQ